MDAGTSGDFHMSIMMPRFFPALGPTILICMGYIDLGKWAAAVDGGCHFGSDLIFLVLAFNCAAILCQYLSVRIGVITGKNLAQICSEEYSKFICILLGVQAELSVLASDLTMILGVAHGLNLLFGLDLVTCIFLTMAIFLFPLFVSLLDRCKADMLLMGMAGFSLVLYLLGVLTSQPEIPLAMSGIFPRLRGESAYNAMSLLGASIMPQNFYLHSSIVQRVPNVSISALCHDHFFAILFTFSGIFLVNYVVMLSAANVFQGGLAVLTIQDSLLLMEQIFRSPIAPFVFVLVLFFSSQVTALTWDLGGQTILHHLLRINPPVWIHRITSKAIATILALFCAWSSGAEGVYQMLIFFQVIVALLLPSSVIPLFRVASSRLIMGAFKISGLMEILCLSAFLGMVASNLIFVVDILFGDDDLMNSMRWNTGSNVTFPYILLLMIASASLLLMLWLVATPLKSASVDRNLGLQNAVLEPSQGREENESRYVEDDKELKDIKAGQDINVVSQFDLDVDLPESITDFDHHEPTEDNSTICTTPRSQPEEQALSPCKELNFSHYGEPNFSCYVESKCSHDDKPKFPNHELLASSVELAPVVENKVPSAESLDGNIVQRAEPKDLVHKAVEVDGDEHVGKDDFETDGWEQEESLAGSLGCVPTAISDGPGSFRSIGGKVDDTSNGSGSFSRLSGLGRAARRNLAAILDEFWGKLFDFHGQIIQEAKGKRIDLLLGLDQKSVSSAKSDTIGTDHMPKFYAEADKGSVFLANPREYDSSKPQRIPTSMDSSYGVQMGLSSWSSYMQSLDAYVQSSCGNSLDANERRYSSLRLPTYSEERDYQPSTIQGYQIPSYLSGIAQGRNMDPLGIALDTSTASKSSSLTSNYKDQLSYSLGLNSLQNSTLPSAASSLLNKLQSERSYYDNSSLVGSVGAVGSTTYPKKYHSLPDISGLAVPNRNSSLGDRCKGAIGPGQSTVRSIMGHQSLYGNTPSRTGGPLAFDELSPSKLYRDVFSPPSSSNLETRSLWSRQPSEQLFGIAGRRRAVGSGDMQETVYRDSEAALLQSLRYCIGRLLRLEGSEWLFQQNGGFDEELIDRVAAREKYIFEAELREDNRLKMGELPFVPSDRKFGSGSRNDERSLAKLLVSPVPFCGEGCIWKIDIVVCFGVWCIHRILEMSLMESRPELWGKYTYVLNRLQGILDLAFSKVRPVLSSPCFCLQIPSMQVKRMSLQIPNGLPPTGGKASSGQCTSAAVLLELIKDVENAVSSRKGRTGTAAGDVAFPKGKENLASVLKRYKRRLSNKSVGVHDGRPGTRKAPIPPVVSFT